MLQARATNAVVVPQADGQATTSCSGVRDDDLELALGGRAGDDDELRRRAAAGGRTNATSSVCCFFWLLLCRA